METYGVKVLKKVLGVGGLNENAIRFRNADQAVDCCVNYLGWNNIVVDGIRRLDNEYFKNHFLVYVPGKLGGFRFVCGAGTFRKISWSDVRGLAAAEMISKNFVVGVNERDKSNVEVVEAKIPFYELDLRKDVFILCKDIEDVKAVLKMRDLYYGCFDYNWQGAKYPMCAYLNNSGILSFDHCDSPWITESVNWGRMVVPAENIEWVKYAPTAQEKHDEKSDINYVFKENVNPLSPREVTIDKKGLDVLMVEDNKVTITIKIHQIDDDYKITPVYRDSEPKTDNSIFSENYSQKDFFVINGDHPDYEKIKLYNDLLAFARVKNDDYKKSKGLTHSSAIYGIFPDAGGGLKVDTISIVFSMYGIAFDRKEDGQECIKLFGDKIKNIIMERFKKWFNNPLKNEWEDFKKINKLWLFIIGFMLIGFVKYGKWRDHRMMKAVSEFTVGYWIEKVDCMLQDAKGGGVVDVTLISMHLDTAHYVFCHDSIVPIIMKKYNESK